MNRDFIKKENEAERSIEAIPGYSLNYSKNDKKHYLFKNDTGRATDSYSIGGFKDAQSALSYIKKTNKMNKGTTKIKAISRRALEIREKAGFTTETIVKKRYKMAYVPDAIKQAAKELKTPGTAKRTKRVVKTKSIAKPKVTEAPKRTKRVLNTRAITKKAAPAPVGAPLVMKRERVRVVKRFVRIKPSGKDFKSIYGVSALKVYEAMQLDKYKSLSIISIFEILTGKRDFDATPEFYGKFIDELAKSGKYLSGKKQISIEWELKGYGLTPVDKMPPKGKAGIYGLTSMVNSDTLRPAMSGVFVEDGYLIATDAHALVIVKDTENLTKKWDGQIIGIRKKDFNQKINEVYPKWRNVMPDPSRSVVTAKVDLEDILPKINGRVQILKSVIDARYIILNIKGNKIGVSPEKLINLLNALRANGSKKAVFHYYDPARAILVETDNGNKGIVMPMLVNDLSTRNDFVVPAININ